MHWAKTRQAARFNLANSGLSPLRFDELGIGVDEFDLTGPSTYGWPPLLEALAVHVEVPIDHLCCAQGTSLANFLALAVCLRPGDAVLIEDPTYALLVDTARYLGAEVRQFPRRREDGFQPDLDALRAVLTPRSRLIVVTNLHNPSSARIPDATLMKLAEIAGNAGGHLLVDEVYLDAAFDPAPRTAHRLSDLIVSTNSLTKVYGLNGLRCGWAAASPTLTERMWRLNDLLGVIPAHPAECLSLVALKHLPALRNRSRILLETNRRAWNVFLARREDLDDRPLTCGTVTFPRLREGKVEALCELLREQFETTVAPGHFFGMADSFRVGLGAPPEIFEEGLRRLGLALDSLQTLRVA